MVDGENPLLGFPHLGNLLLGILLVPGICGVISVPKNLGETIVVIPGWIKSIPCLDFHSLGILLTPYI